MTEDEHTIAEPMDFIRIMAAWNACEGISTESLNNGAVMDMLEALRKFESHYPMGINPYLDEAARAARAAITKATGDTQ